MTEAFAWAKIKAEQAEKLSGDASTRAYFRIRGKNRRTVLMAFASDELSQKQSKRFVKVQEWLYGLGIPVPAVLDISADHRFYLLEDLGDLMLETWLEGHPPASEIEKQYQILGEYLHAMQASPPAELLSEAESLGKERLLWELHFFHKHFFGQEHFSPFEGHYEKVAADASRRALTAAHRDYHCRNVMIHQDNLYLVDFQDARWAHPLYDLASLLYDAYYNCGEKIRDSVLYGWKFTEDLPAVALQRNLKAVGTFAYQAREHKKTFYLRFIPRCLAYIRAHLQRLGWTEKFGDLVKAMELSELICE